MLKVKVADDIYSLQKGLMFVEDLPEDEGMLFVFNRPQKLSFWGENTLIPLDIAFINEKNIITKIDNIEILDLSAVTSDEKCIMAIEANKGYFSKNNINIGDSISINREIRISGILIPNIAIIKFNNNNGISKEAGIINDGYNKIKDWVKGFLGMTANPSELKNVSPSAPPVFNNKVNKPNAAPIGEPIKNDNVDNNLPVFNANDFNGFVEDNFDKEEEKPQENDQTQREDPKEIVKPEIEEPQEENNETQNDQIKYPVFSTAFEAAKWAEDNNEVIRISYKTKHGRNLVRDVEPHGTFHAKSTKREILVTWDETIGDIRAFILTNISKWAFIKKKFDKKFVVK